ncbi:MAG: UDP-N-acetylmuramoyl-L-alanyl-D-glutamate--2,6-diaminopimelate ligase [Bacteroidales bacterium]|nr:UDP-N-acetylmuramoyl-L-alanyl-D-glutamate--2,6-diaminopimelate ligase [Bacteroidales bacterium]MDY3783295.1 UDP-N-acetylmuramoyl-L-alanyl-D-glutamate--2,6-diaminopimelate ligase [Candidatus Cryptobacteroides sp.]
MKLSEIIKNTGASILKGSPETEISAICSDSRKATEGSLFIATAGCSADGHDFIADALSRGAAAVVDADRKALALCADKFYSHPSGELELVGITGTNGKTTTVTLLYNLFRSLGYECGLLSTIANFVGAHRLETANTTADPITINSLLREMVDAGCQYCFMEVSSIGLEQERVAGLEFRIGIFSNLTHDHLDYHKTFAEYLRCKKLFFDNLPKKATAIINADDRNGMVMVQNCAAKVVSYSCRSVADHNCRILEQSFEGMMLKLDGTEVWTRLIGAHNAYNLLAIYCTALELGADRDEVLLALSRLESAKGRLETIRGPRDLAVVIDYAHTPDALENVLGTLRAVSPKRNLVCCFGCGGDRDKTKRPEMAAIAEKMADRIFITSDNCRTEDPESIISDIRAGLSPEGLSKTVCITDRREAIRAAITLSPDSSTILLAGKGHETYQIIGKEYHHFDEREIVKEVLGL